MGCVSGRFIDVVRKKGGVGIGVDFSSAVEAAAHNFKKDDDVCICQTDALNLPIQKNCVDGAFSIGVLHHSPQPGAGLNSFGQHFGIIRLLFCNLRLIEGWLTLRFLRFEVLC